MSLGRKIRDFRKERGITLTRLAGKLGISPSYLSAIERNMRRPSIQMLKRLGNQLNIPVNYLVGSDEDVLTGKRLKFMRENRNLSLEELSEICDMPAGMLERIEDGQESPDLECLKKMSQGLNVTIKYFLDSGGGNNLGRRLKKVRLSRGHTVVSLARGSNITEENLRLIESGEISPDLETLEAIAGILNTSLAYLLMESKDVEDLLATLGTDMLDMLADPDVQASLKLLKNFQPGDMRHIINYIQFFKRNQC